MSKKWIILLSILLAVCLTFGAIAIIFAGKDENDDTTEDNKDIFISDELVKFENGNENMLSPKVLNYIERMERGIPAVDFDGNYYLDDAGYLEYEGTNERSIKKLWENLIRIINYFANKDYSLTASHQIQSFYVEYHDALEDMNFEELTSKLEICFPKEGTTLSELKEKVENQFGYIIDENNSFVFSSIFMSEIKAEFYNVLPPRVQVSPKIESVCIYDDWESKEDNDYERNLEGWLHNVIFAVLKAGLSNEKAIVAQIVFAGSIFDSNYSPCWEEDLIECLTIDEWIYDNFKLAIYEKFGVNLDNNVQIQKYFEEKTLEVIQ